MSLLGKIICAVKRSHVWRRARKDEDAKLKYCARCSETQALRKRKTKGAS